MTCYLYNRETSLEIYSTCIYQSLRELNYQVTLTDHISGDSEKDLYLILGGQYLTDVPQNYIIIQTVPTSHLTKVNKIEAYWMDKTYINLLKGAQAIWDISKENIKIFQDYYQLSNIHYLEFGYTSILTEKVRNLTQLNRLPTVTPTSQIETYPIVVIGEDRADKWLRSLGKQETKMFNLTLRSPNQPFQLIASLKASQCPALLLANYDNTYVDISLCCALRYNGIPCLVEQSRDIEINKLLTSLGCQLIPWIRLSKHFKNSVTPLYQNGQMTKQDLPKNLTLARRLSTPLLATIEAYQEQKQGNDGTNNRENETASSKGSKKNKRKKKGHSQAIKLYAREAIADVNYELLEDGGIALKLGEVKDEDLPNITICTPTANRRVLFSLATRNFMSFIYPSDKLRWNILDNGEVSIQDIVPNDYRIHYQYIDCAEQKLSVAEMRNRLVDTSDTDIILFMDDDDYYPPESLLARTKALLKYQKDGIQCVGCRDVASYDLKQGLCAICSNGEEYVTESSLAFTKTFWKTRPFRNIDQASEYRYFLEYRQHAIKSIPFQFVTIALTHGKNTTGGVRDLDFYRKWKPSENWEDTKNSILNVLDEETQDFLNLLKKLVC